MTASRSDHLIERAAQRFRNQPLLDAEISPPSPRPAMSPPPLQQIAAPSVAASAPLVEELAVPLVRIKTMQRAGLAVLGATRSRVIEEWRIIASSLLRLQRSRRDGLSLKNAIMITSSRAREGKSFCSINLAVTVAKNRQAPTILIDIDAKPNSLTKLLDLAERPGLLDLAAQPASTVAGLLVPTELPNLSVLPLGSHSGEGSDAGINHSVVAVLEQLAREFPNHLLIMDTAPCLATSDASTLAPLVGQTAVIVEAETTQKRDLDTTLGLLAACDTISLVLNKARGQSFGHFGTEDYGFGDAAPR